jgi:hypothetical protein
MNNQITLNLPVKGLDKSKAFFPLSALPSMPIQRSEHSVHADRR